MRLPYSEFYNSRRKLSFEDEGMQQDQVEAASAPVVAAAVLDKPGVVASAAPVVDRTGVVLFAAPDVSAPVASNFTKSDQDQHDLRNKIEQEVEEYYSELDEKTGLKIYIVLFYLFFYFFIK